MKSNHFTTVCYLCHFVFKWSKQIKVCLQSILYSQYIYIYIYLPSQKQPSKFHIVWKLLNTPNTMESKYSEILFAVILLRSIIILNLGVWKIHKSWWLMVKISAMFVNMSITGKITKPISFQNFTLQSISPT